jgi:chromosome segregation ATPase
MATECSYQCIVFDEELDRHKKAADAVDDKIASIKQENEKIEVWTSAITKAKDDLYYLDKQIQSVGSDRDGLKKKHDQLDGEESDSEHQNLADEIHALDKKIENMRDDQQAANKKLEVQEDGLKSQQSSLSSLQAELTAAIQTRDGYYDDLKKRLQLIKEKCGDYQGRDLPRNG